MKSNLFLDNEDFWAPKKFTCVYLQRAPLRRIGAVASHVRFFEQFSIITFGQTCSTELSDETSPLIIE